MKLRIVFAVLTLGLLSTSVQVQADYIANGVRVHAPTPFLANRAIATGKFIGGGNGPGTGGFHVVDSQRGTGRMVVGSGSGVHYDRMTQDLMKPEGSAMHHGSNPAPRAYPFDSRFSGPFFHSAYRSN
jgi:hypothetical protein